MKYVVAIYPDGVCGKFEEGTDVYEQLVPVVKNRDPHFTPYDDDPNLPQNWMDITGMVGKGRLFIRDNTPTSERLIINPNDN